MSGFRTFEIENQFQTGLEPVLISNVRFGRLRLGRSKSGHFKVNGPDVQKPDIYVPFSDKHLKTGRLGTGHVSKTLKSGRPVFGRLLYSIYNVIRI